MHESESDSNDEFCPGRSLARAWQENLRAGAGDCQGWCSCPCRAAVTGVSPPLAAATERHSAAMLVCVRSDLTAE